MGDEDFPLIVDGLFIHEVLKRRISDQLKTVCQLHEVLKRIYE